MSYTDLVIDCETLGVSTNNPAIVQIGAVEFNIRDGGIGLRFNRYITLDDAIKHGHVDGSTLTWWLTQAEAAEDVFCNRERSSLEDALSSLFAMIRSGGYERIWFNGPMEDGAWLKSAYNAIGIEVPWPHYVSRDMRTLVEISGINLSTIPSEGTPHNALDDALWQAKVIHAAHRKLSALVNA